jgi:hypothetical protein
MVSEEALIYIGALGVALVIVVYIELRIIRKRRSNDFDEEIAQDTAYNHILAAKAASESLSRQGKDTSRADALLMRAEVEFRSGDFMKADDTVKTARESLSQSQDKLLSMPAAEPDDETEVAQPESVHAVKKLPKDYLEAKFMISKAAADVETAQKEGREVVEATKLLDGAREAFAADDYTLALKKSINAQKWIGQKVPDAEPEGPPNETVIAEKPHYMAKMAEGKCACGNGLSPDDNFCRRCGAKVPKPYDCPQCAERVEPEDQFCRHCGKTLKETTPCPRCGAALGPGSSSCYACGASVGSQAKV